MKRGDVKHGRVTASKSDSNKTFKSLSDEFIGNAKIRGLSEWTIKTYQYQINYFTEFAGEDLLCKDIHLELLESYLCYLKEKKQISNPSTLNSSMQNISPVIRYGLKKRYILNQFQMPYVKGQETFKDIYTEVELKTLLEAPSSKDFTTIKTYTIIWLIGFILLHNKNGLVSFMDTNPFSNQLIPQSLDALHY